MNAELLLLFCLLNVVFGHVISDREILFGVHQYFSFAILKCLNFDSYFQEKVVPQTAFTYR